MEARKRAHYAVEIQHMDGDFFPFVIDTYGNWGPSASAFVKGLPRMLPSCNSLTDMSDTEFKRYVVEAVSIAIQVGNHVMYADGLSRSLQNQLFVPAG